ncbi:MAG TPA: cupredoxin domain-containing protein [Actinomycetota bacterium]|nr:cupredoxin domain-containing protein [Actinomycetota bacterium]
MSTQDDSLRPDLTTEVRFKVPLPLVIPLGALAVIGIVAFGFAQILLAVPKEAATMLAIVASANVLGAFAYAALRPRMQPVTMAELGIIVLYPVIIGLAIAQFDFGGEHGHALAEEAGAGAAAEGAAPAGPTTAIAAEGNAFDLETIVLEAKKQTSLEFDNQDSGIDHNLAIYESEPASEDNVIFDGEVLTGPDAITYEFKAPRKGEYYFQCDIHPDMNGTVTSE